MKNWKTKLCGDNRFNFYGWIVAGLLVFIVAGFELGSALWPGMAPSKVLHHLLLGIFFLLLGQFGLSLQNYCSRVAKSLDDQDARNKNKTDDDRKSAS